MNQTRPHCVNQMEKTYSKPLEARHGKGTAWARHAVYGSAFRRKTKVEGIVPKAERHCGSSSSVVKDHLREPCRIPLYVGLPST